MRRPPPQGGGGHDPVAPQIGYAGIVAKAAAEARQRWIARRRKAAAGG